MKRNIRIASLVMLTGLIGLLSFQAYWISSVYNQNRRDIENDVKSALSKANSNLLIKKLGNISGVQVTMPNARSTSFDVDNLIIEGNSITNPSGTFIIHGDSTLESISNTSPKTITLRGSDSSKSNYISLRDPQATFKLNTPDSTWEFSRASKPNRSVDQLDFLYMDSLLYLGLKEYDFEKNYFFGYKNEAEKTFEFTNQPLEVDLSNEDKNSYSIKSFIIDGSEQYSLYLRFPDNRVELASLSQITSILAASVIMILLLVSAWFYIIRSLQKQYQLAQMKDDFISNMTHELKTPVTASSLALEVISKKPSIKADPELDGLIHLARQEQQRMFDIVDSILDGTTVQSLSFDHLEILDVNEEVSALVETIGIKVSESGGAISFQKFPEPLKIKAEQVHFQNAVLNVLDNAVKYSGNAPEIFVGVSKDDEKLRLEITDKGIGISKKDQERIFDRFFRVHTGNVHTVKGYGLGLNYTKTIVEKLGGTIHVQSSETGGTTFIIKLPLSNET